MFSNNTIQYYTYNQFRKLLVTDIIELKNAKLEEHRDTSEGDNTIQHEDPVMLKLKFTYVYIFCCYCFCLLLFFCFFDQSSKRGFKKC